MLMQLYQIYNTYANVTYLDRKLNNKYSTIVVSDVPHTQCIRTAGYYLIHKFFLKRASD